MNLIPKSEEQSYRIKIYFDCISGSIIAIAAISIIIFTSLSKGIELPWLFALTLTFWISWLIFSLFIIGLGIYTYYQEKHFDEKNQKKELKPPKVS